MGQVGFPENVNDTIYQANRVEKKFHLVHEKKIRVVIKFHLVHEKKVQGGKKLQNS